MCCVATVSEVGKGGVSVASGHWVVQATPFRTGLAHTGRKAAEGLQLLEQADSALMSAI